MGDLVKMPYSEVTATLELLDRWGVKPEHLARFRAASSYIQQMVAEALIRCDEKFFVGAPMLLKQSATTTPVPAIPKFSAQETFGAEKPTVKIGYLGDNFKNYFLGKVETNISATTLTARTLTKSSLDGPILTELGDRAETSLVHLWHLLSRQPNGESGILLTNGDWNVFYIRDDNGTLWAVCADWRASGGDWGVGARSVDCPYGWSAGSRVFSRK